MERTGRKEKFFCFSLYINLLKVTSALKAEPGPWSQVSCEASHLNFLSHSGLAVNSGRVSTGRAQGRRTTRGWVCHSVVPSRQWFASWTLPPWAQISSFFIYHSEPTSSASLQAWDVRGPRSSELVPLTHFPCALTGFCYPLVGLVIPLPAAPHPKSVGNFPTGNSHTTLPPYPSN